MKKITKLFLCLGAVAILGGGAFLGYYYRNEIKGLFKKDKIEAEKPDTPTENPDTPIPLTCKVEFEVPGEELETTEVAYGFELKMPEMDRIDGYIFQGFKIYGSGREGSIIKSGNILRVTSYTKIVAYYAKIVPIGFDVDGEINYVDCLEGLGLQYREPSKVGFNFEGWSLDDGKTLVNVNRYTVTETVIFKAVFSYKYYNVDFVLSETMRLSCNFRSDNQLYVPTPLSIEGKNCLGWSKDNETVYNFANVITEDTTFYPLYEDIQEVVEPFEFQDGVLVKYAGNEREVVIPNTYDVDGRQFSVTSIASTAFKDNKEIYSVRLPASVELIGDEAFSGCTNLSQILVKSLVLPDMGLDVFKDISENAILYCKLSEEGYANENYEKYFSIFDGRIYGLDAFSRGCSFSFTEEQLNNIYEKSKRSDPLYPNLDYTQTEITQCIYFYEVGTLNFFFEGIDTEGHKVVTSWDFQIGEDQEINEEYVCDLFNNLSVENSGCLIVYYTMTFTVDGNEYKVLEVPSIGYVISNSGRVDNPTKEGYRFAGWKCGETIYEDVSPIDPSDDMTFEAVFEEVDINE